MFRPFHDLLAVYLRREQVTTQDYATAAAEGQQLRASAEQHITDALLGTVPSDGESQDWAAAHPYLRTYLAQHAKEAGPEALSALAQDADFLAAADPITLAPLLSPTDPSLGGIARAYRRAYPMLGADIRANAAFIQEAARALTGDVPQATRIPPLYHTRLASVLRDDSLFSFTSPGGRSVAFGTGPDGRLLLASASSTGVRVWDAVSGTPVGEPLNGGDAVAFGTGPDGRLLLASASSAGVRVWDAVSGTPVTDIRQRLKKGPMVWDGGLKQLAQGPVAFGLGPDGRLLVAVITREWGKFALDSARLGRDHRHSPPATASWPPDGLPGAQRQSGRPPARLRQRIQQPTLGRELDTILSELLDIGSRHGREHR